MFRRYEWRRGSSYGDVILVVDTGTERIVSAFVANRDTLTDFLNDMQLLRTADTGRWDHPAVIDPDSPEADWGDLVLERSDDGQVISIDPERYWDSIATWFRAHGDDPHRWRARATGSAAS